MSTSFNREAKPETFRCGHPKQGQNLQYMGGYAVCRKCRIVSRNKHREKYRSRYLAEAIGRAKDKLFLLYREAKDLGRDDLIPSEWEDDRC